MKQDVIKAGFRVGKWVVLDPDYTVTKPRRAWVRCDCGTERSILKFALVNGSSKTCGCSSYENRPKDNPKVDISSQRFGLLVALRRMLAVEEPGRRERRWLCRCDCGVEVAVGLDKLKSGHTKSCGCQKFKSADLAEQRFGTLLAIEDAGQAVSQSGRPRGRLWRCECDCGGEAIVKASNLLSGKTKTCGCGTLGQDDAAIAAASAEQ